MKKFFALTIALMFTFVISKAQQNVYLHIHHKLGNVNFALNQAAQNDLAQNFRITRADYYLSSISIIHDGGQEMPITNKYILAKAESDVHELLGNLNVTNVEGIKFSIGVEAPTNNQDPTLWSASHPLSPKSPSMHWGWSAGYIFVALEGNAGNNFATGFEMHGLKNANYFTQTQMAAGVVTNGELTINLDADITQAVKGINVNAGPNDHGANATDLDVLKNFRDNVFKPSANPMAIASQALAGINIYPNPSAATFYIQKLNTAKGATQAIVFDIAGRKVMEKNLDAPLNTLEIEKAGTYNLLLMNEKQVLGSTVLIKE